MQKPTVFLVKDDGADLSALEAMLTGTQHRYDFELLTESSGSAALRRLQERPAGLAIAPPGLAETGAMAATHTPILVIAPPGTPASCAQRAYAAGAADYLAAPFDPAIVQAKVRIFTELQRQTLVLEARGASLRQKHVEALERSNRELAQEVAERKQAELRAQALAVRDALTGLANRRALLEQLEHAVATADRQRGEFALLFLDLDRFKAINDTLGHEVGDELLRQVAARLLAAVRASDTVARLGGDEFVVLLEGHGAASHAARVAEKIERAHASSFTINGQQVRTSTSIGIAVYPRDARDAAGLLHNADAAMYDAKKNRRGGITFFSAELNAREADRARRAHDLHAALRRKQLRLRFSPKMKVADASLAGMEALLYWEHPREGLVPALPYLDHLADPGLLDRINEWTLAAVCTQAAQWRATGGALAALPLSVNLSAALVMPDMVPRILTLARRCQLPEGWLELEICEDLLVAGVDVVDVLRQLAAGGVRIAVDDFGRGNSSLVALKHLPLSVLKIDHSFVAALGSGDGARDMIDAIIHLARAMDMSVLAQGVERADQLAILKTLHCDLFQGALCGAPLDASAVPDFLQHPTSTTEGMHP